MSISVWQTIVIALLSECYPAWCEIACLGMQVEIREMVPGQAAA